MSAFKFSTTRRGFLGLAGAMGLVATMNACSKDNPNVSSGEKTSGGAAGEANKDGTIDAGISYELGTNGYDPMTTTAALTIAVNWHILEGLTEMDPVTMETYSALADKLPEPTDDVNIDVKLREGAKFHNGEAVTAEDVVFSFERVMNPDNNSLYRQFIPFIKSVEKKDDTTVTFHLAYPVGVFAERLSCVKIVPKAAVEADHDAFDAKPIGTGPYKLIDNGGSSKTVVFERFDDYTGQRPAKAKKMNWKIMPDASTRSNALQSKTVQAIDSVPYIAIDSLKNTASVESVQGFGLLFAMFNLTEGKPFADKRNRQAFMYALDLKKVVETGMSNQATPSSSFLQKEHANYHAAATQYDRDLDKAKKLFGETGLKSMRLLCTDHDWVAKCTPLIQESLKEAGLEVAFEQKKSSDVYNTIDGNNDAFDVVIAPGDPSVFGNDPDLLMRWWYAGDVWTDQRMHWKGSESYNQVQKLLDEALQATTKEAQQGKWNEIFDIIAEELPLYPLFHRKTPTGWDPDTLIDFKPISLTGLSFQNVGTTK